MLSVSPSARRRGELVHRGDDHVATVARSLMDKPQPLGFLPTWWFWRELYRERRFRVLMAVLTLPAWGLTLAWWTFIGNSFLAPVLLVYLVEGLVEKLVRREIVRRRTALLAEPSLGRDPAVPRLP